MQNLEYSRQLMHKFKIKLRLALVSDANYINVRQKHRRFNLRLGSPDLVLCGDGKQMLMTSNSREVEVIVILENLPSVFNL